jgi:aryl-alcohol dehydrogenase-like predicted oxidoreductase
MRETLLGQEGLRVSVLGLGCMGMSFAYAGADEEESRATLREAVESGITLFDTADIYGPHTNEELVGQELRAVREDVVIATKFGNVHLPDGTRRIDGSPGYVREACEESLRRLGVDVIDLYFQHRVDPDTPIEETVGAMADLVAAGKVRAIGLSEASADTIRRAHAVHPLTAVQTEYSLWARDVEHEVLPALRELGIGLVAYSPLGRGFLTGLIRSRDAIAEGDSRRRFPRFADENLARNLTLLEGLEGVAARVGVPLAQLSLAWVLAQGEDVVPIPGTTRRAHLRENLGALEVRLSDEDIEAVRRLVESHEVAGERYPQEMMGAIQT